MNAGRIAGVTVVAASLALGAAAGLARSQPGPPLASRPPSPSPSVTGAPSALIYPAQSLPLRFDHAAHARLGARCEACHAAALSSTAAADDLMPAEAACRACHAIDRTQPDKTVAAGQGAARCDACHLTPSGAGWTPPGPLAEPARVRVVRPNLKFNHQQHAARGVGCEVCHAGVSSRGLATRDDLPVMALCLACHTGSGGGARAATAEAPAGHAPTGRCGACHLTEPDGRLKVALASAATAAVGTPEGSGKLIPSGALRGFDAHGPTFRRDHRMAARDEGYCLSCHRRNECVDCHGGVVRPPDIHPADYVSLHGSDARRNTPDCSSCHRNQTFCLGCHQRTGVSADPEGGQPGRQPRNPFGTGTQLKRFHPPGWVRDDAGGVIGAATASSHSLQAKRNVRACASCHREESCLACHSADPTRSIAVSPHGPNFGHTARCRALAARNQRVCLKCHSVGSPALDCDGGP